MAYYNCISSAGNPERHRRKLLLNLSGRTWIKNKYPVRTADPRVELELRKNYAVGSLQNSIQEEIKSRLKLGNACYHSVQNLFTYSLLSKNIKIKIYRTIILPVVLYGCETWSLTLRGERRLRVFENRVLRRVFGPKRDEVTGDWRKLHNEELSDLFSLPNIVRAVKSRRMRWAVHVARMGEGRGVHRVLVGKPERKRPLGRPRHRWENNIKMDLQEVGAGCADWIELTQDRERWRALVSKVMNFRVP